MEKIQFEHNRHYYISKQLKEQLSFVTHYPLTILEAPMGYGKTTALRVFFSQMRVQMDWLYMVEGSTSLFWKGFAHFIHKIDASSGEALLKLDLPNDQVTLQKMLEIVQSLDIKHRHLLIVEDYHLIDNPIIQKIIMHLTVLHKANFHIVLNCRHIALDVFEEIKLKGLAYHLTKEVLSFTIGDIRKYFSLNKITLKKSEAQFLENYTEGWISAIYLLLLDYLREGKFNELNVPDHLPTIYTLFERSIFNVLTEEEKEILIYLSCFDYFTIEQAKYISGKCDAITLLSSISKKNAFMTYDPKLREYRMHRILINFLVEKYNLLSWELKEHINKRAAEWYKKTGQYLHSISWYYKNKDYAQIAEVVILDQSQSITPDQKELMIQYYRECPREVKLNYPLAVLIYGVCLFTFNEIEYFQKLCMELPSIIEESCSLNIHEKQLLMGEFELLLGFTAYNSIEGMHRHHLNALKLLKGPSQIIINTEGWTMGSPSVLYMFYREAGTLQKVVEFMPQAMLTYYKISSFHGAGADYALKAEGLFYSGQFMQAEIEAHKAVQIAKKHCQYEIILCMQFLAIRISIAHGKKDEAIVKMKKLRSDVEENKRQSLYHTVDLCEGYICGLLSQVEKAPKWISNGDFNSDRLYLAALSYYHVVYCRLLLSRQRFTELLGLVDDFIERSRFFPNLLSVIILLIYKAAANEQLFRRKEALIFLKEAFDLAMADQLYMAFVEVAPYIIHILDQLAEDEAYRWHVSRVKALYYSQNPRKELEENKIDYQINEELTSRELEIAELAAKSYSNKEIAAELFISENTVKTTLKNIFKKLSIKSRTQLKERLNKSIQ